MNEWQKEFKKASNTRNLAPFNLINIINNRNYGDPTRTGKGRRIPLPAAQIASRIKATHAQARLRIGQPYSMNLECWYWYSNYQGSIWAFITGEQPYITHGQYNWLNQYEELFIIRNMYTGEEKATNYIPIQVKQRAIQPIFLDEAINFYLPECLIIINGNILYKTGEPSQVFTSQNGMKFTKSRVFKGQGGLSCGMPGITLADRTTTPLQYDSMRENTWNQPENVKYEFPIIAVGVERFGEFFEIPWGSLIHKS